MSTYSHGALKIPLNRRIINSLSSISSNYCTSIFLLRVEIVIIWNKRVRVSIRNWLFSSAKCCISFRILILSLICLMSLLESRWQVFISGWFCACKSIRAWVLILLVHARLPQFFKSLLWSLLFLHCFFNYSWSPTLSWRNCSSSCVLLMKVLATHWIHV